MLPRVVGKVIPEDVAVVKVSVKVSISRNLVHSLVHVLVSVIMPGKRNDSAQARTQKFLKGRGWHRWGIPTKKLQ